MAAVCWPHFSVMVKMTALTDLTRKIAVSLEHLHEWSFEAKLTTRTQLLLTVFTEFYVNTHKCVLVLLWSTPSLVPRPPPF